MEKILIVANASKFNKSFIDFSTYIANVTKSRLTCICLIDAAEVSEPALKTHYAMPEVGGLVNVESEWSTSKQQVPDENVLLFQNAFSNRGISCAVRQAGPDSVTEIISESRFADLMVMDPEMSINGNPDEVPTAFVKQLLASVECPVVLSPYAFYGIDEVLFAYDGSASSVFAIKEFIHVFPMFQDTKVTVLQVNEGTALSIAEKDKIRELLTAHYSKVNFIALEGRAADELFGYLLLKKNTFVVMGAFGRNLLSSFFKPSTAELILKAVDLPIFIAHH